MEGQTAVATSKPSQVQNRNMAVAAETVAALDEAAGRGIIALREASQFKKMFLLAGAMTDLKALLTPQVMAPVMALQNTSTGFKTDNPSGYSVDVVRECIIEACIQGVFPTGNEFNIIAARCYITKEGFGHKLRDVNGLYYSITPGIPKTCGESGAIVKMLINWTINKKQSQREIEFAIRVNKGMGADAIIGKATRKARAWLYAEVTGNEAPDGDVDDGQIIDVEDSRSEFEKDARATAGKTPDAPNGGQPAGAPEGGEELPM